MGPDPLTGSANVADPGHRNAFRANGRHQGLGGIGAADHQQAAGTDQSQGVNMHQPADPIGHGQDGNAIQMDVKLVAAGAAQFGNGGGNAAFGNVMHGGDVGHAACDRRFRQDADLIHQTPTVLQFGGRQSQGKQSVGKCIGDNGGSLDSDPLGQEHTISRPHIPFVDQVLARHGGAQGTHHNRALNRIGDFGVAAAEGDPPMAAGRIDIGHDLKNSGGRRVGRKQKGCHQPLGDGTRGGDVIGVDQYGIGADLIGDERNGIGCDHQRVLMRDVDGRGILPNAWFNEEAALVMLQVSEEFLQQIVGEFAVGKGAAAAHDPFDFR